MQLLQAISMLLLGSVIGVLCTLFDVALVGSPAFFTRFALWALVNVVFATHIRNRWRAVWWSVPFNLGLVESYFLSTAFSFENIARSLAVPLALLALVAPFLVALAWTARHERRNLYGRLLGVVFTLAIVVVSGVTSHAVSVGDVVCALLSLLFMFFIPTHTVAMVELEGEDHVVRVEGAGVSHHEPRERLSASRQMRQRRVHRQERARKQQRRNEARPVREPLAREASGAGMPRAERSQRAATAGSVPADAHGKQGARMEGRKLGEQASEPRLRPASYRGRVRQEAARDHNQGGRAASRTERSRGAEQRRRSHAPLRPQRTSSSVPRMSAPQRPVVHPAGGEVPVRGVASGTARPHKRQRVVIDNSPSTRSRAPQASQRNQQPHAVQERNRGTRGSRGGSPRPHDRGRAQHPQAQRPATSHSRLPSPSRRRGSNGQSPHVRRPR